MVVFLLALALQAQAPDDPAITEQINTFEAAFNKSKDPAQKAALVQNLSRTENEKILQKVTTYLSNEDKNVRMAAIRGLGMWTNATPELRKSATHALSGAISAGVNMRDPDCKEAILTSIGPLQDDSAATLLKSHYEDTEVKIASAAVGASGALKCKNLIDPLITLLRECEKKANPNQDQQSSAPSKKMTYMPRAKGNNNNNTQNDPEAQKRDRAANLIPVIQQALSTLTAQAFPTAAEWDKWWGHNKGSFIVQKTP